MKEEIVLFPLKKFNSIKMCYRKVHFYLYVLQCCQLFLLNAVKLLLVRQVDGGHLVILRSL